MADIRTPKFWINLAKKVVKTVLKSKGIRTSPPTNNQHVVPHEKGWAVKGEGNEKYTAFFDTQAEAIERAKAIAYGLGASVVIHRKDGTIRDRISYK